MLSRIADSLFWLSRYVERADGLLRMLRVNFITSLDKSSGADFNWQPVLTIFTTIKGGGSTAVPNEANAVLQYMISDTKNENSIHIIISRARENARGMQDHLTKEAWESINEYYLRLHN